MKENPHLAIQQASITALEEEFGKDFNQFDRAIERIYLDLARIHPRLYEMIGTVEDEIPNPVSYITGAAVAYETLLLQSKAKKEYLLVTWRDVEEYKESIVQAIISEQTKPFETDADARQFAVAAFECGEVPEVSIDWFFDDLSKHSKEFVEYVRVIMAAQETRRERMNVFRGVMDVLGPVSRSVTKIGRKTKMRYEVSDKIAGGSDSKSAL